MLPATIMNLILSELRGMLPFHCDKVDDEVTIRIVMSGPMSGSYICSVQIYCKLFKSED